MEDGTWKEFSYRGVYYFKNSWGLRVSGRDFKLQGKNFPGYGMITQKYAHELGTFYHPPLNLKLYLKFLRISPILILKSP